MLLKSFEAVQEPLRFPIGDQVFEGFGPSIGDWELILRIEAGTATEEETAGADMYRLALGALHDELVQAGVPLEAYKAAALACAAWARTSDPKIAAAVWENGANRDAVTAAAGVAEPPAEPTPKPAAKRRARKPAA